MVHVKPKVLTEDNDVVKVYKARLPLKPTQVDVECPLESGWRINQLEGHGFESVRARLEDECRLVPVVLVSLHLPIP